MVEFYNKIWRGLSVIAGPCVYEGYEHARYMIHKLQDITQRQGVNFIYKTSFDKANRTSKDSFRGLDFESTMLSWESLQEETGVEFLTDVHEQWQCKEVRAHILQIPAFLCRQTDLLYAAGKTGLPVSVKKGQFLSPLEMKNVIDKLESIGCTKILLTERGTTFGYNNLVVDFRSIPIMKQSGYPIVIDCTHSVQQPGGLGTTSGGDRDMARYIARAGLAVGADVVFMEVHDDPDNAPSDGPNMIRLDNFETLLNELKDVWKIRPKSINGV